MWRGENGFGEHNQKNLQVGVAFKTSSQGEVSPSQNFGVFSVKELSGLNQDSLKNVMFLFADSKNVYRYLLVNDYIYLKFINGQLSEFFQDLRRIIFGKISFDVKSFTQMTSGKIFKTIFVCNFLFCYLPKITSNGLVHICVC